MTKERIFKNLDGFNGFNGFISALCKSVGLDDIVDGIMDSMDDMEGEQHHCHQKGERMRTPDINIMEGDESFIIEIDLPDFEKTDLSVVSTFKSIKVTTKRGIDENEDEIKYLCRERFNSNYTRKIELPSVIEGEKTKATYTNGVLTIIAAKHKELGEKEIKIE